MQTEEQRPLQPQALSDGVLTQQALEGQHWAFETLVHRYRPILFPYIYHFLGDYDQASDCLQSVWLRLSASLPTLRTDSSLKPWLFQVARNRCIDDLRQHTRRRTLCFSEVERVSDEGECSFLEMLPDSAPLPEEVVADQDLQKHLRQAIDALPPKFRDVVFLRYATPWSFAEIAQTLNMRTATAKTYFQRAKLLLRVSLRDLVGQIMAEE
jgi:RNA polymerase sigma factor (sigma-70 family)